MTLIWGYATTQSKNTLARLYYREYIKVTTLVSKEDNARTVLQQTVDSESRADIKSTDSSQVRRAITQESVKYQNEKSVNRNTPFLFFFLHNCSKKTIYHKI